MGRVCRDWKDGSGEVDEMILLEVEVRDDGSTAEVDGEGKRVGGGRAKRKNRWSAGEAEPRAGPGNGLEQRVRAL